MTLGEKIARHRKFKNWTQEQFAAAVGVHSRHVSRWETNRVQPSLATLQRIAEVLEIGIETLTGNSNRAEALPARDPEIAGYLRDLESLDEEDRFVVRKVIDAMLTKKRLRRALEAS